MSPIVICRINIYKHYLCNISPQGLGFVTVDQSWPLLWDSCLWIHNLSFFLHHLGFLPPPSQWIKPTCYPFINSQNRHFVSLLSSPFAIPHEHWTRAKCLWHMLPTDINCFCGYWRPQSLVHWIYSELISNCLSHMTFSMEVWYDLWWCKHIILIYNWILRPLLEKK